MTTDGELILSTFFKIHQLQLNKKKDEALSLIRSAITNHTSSPIEHSLWTWLLTEQVLQFSEKEALSEFAPFIEHTVNLVEENWDKPQKHVYLPLPNDVFTLHLAIYYATLLNLKNLGYRHSIQQTATAIRDRVFENQLRGGMVISAPSHPFAATDLLLAVLPFGLFSPEDLVMVEAVKDIEKKFVHSEKVLAFPQSKEHSNVASALLAWYFLEKGNHTQSKHYLKLTNSSPNTAGYYLENIINHYLSLEKNTFLITHEPFGNENKYEPQIFERFPRIPVENEEVIIQFTAPYSLKASAYVRVVTSTNTWVVEATHVSQESSFWKANIGSFSAHEEVTYFIEWSENGKKLTTSSYVFYPLRKVNIWNLVGYKINNNTFDFVPKYREAPFRLTLDTKEQQFHFHKDDTTYEKKNCIVDINEIFKEQGLPQFYNESYLAPISLLVDRFGHWIDVSLRFYSPLNERFFGMGERYHQLEYRGEELDCYVYNQYRDQGARTYMPIPFFISSLKYGLYINTSCYTRFDFAKTYADVLSLSISQQREEKTTFYFYKGSPSEIVSNFTNQTGPAKMLPVWAFGPWMSSNNWDRDEVVRYQVEKTTELQIPATVIVLEQWSDESTYYIFNDAIYEPTDGSTALSYGDYIYPKWGRWPKPKELVEFIQKHGMELILWQIPIMKYLNRQHHPQKDHDEAYMLKKQYYIKDKNHKPYRIPEGWFKESLLMDFSNQEGVEWWFKKRKYLLDIGVAGFKTDGGEMVFGDQIQFADQRLGSEMRNEYPNEYIKAYHEFAEGHRPNNAMTFSRAGYTGAQKFPAHWAGDERSTFEAFKRSLIAGLSAGLSGVIMWGWDLAGFNGDIPSAELFIRSAQMAAFCPIMQYHAESKAEFNQDRTPWNIAERTKDDRAISGYRFYANVRMNLLPYIVEQAKLSVSNAIPLMRAMLLECPEDSKTFSMFDQYFFGEKLLVAPIIQESSERRSVYLPLDKWVNLFTKEVYRGSQFIEVNAPLMEIPVFQRNNSCIITNVSKENKSLGSYIGNEVHTFSHPLVHIVSNQSFIYEGSDHLHQSWKISVLQLKNDAIRVDIKSNHNEFSISFTNTLDRAISLYVNGTSLPKLVPPHKTVIMEVSMMEEN